LPIVAKSKVYHFRRDNITILEEPGVHAIVNAWPDFIIVSRHQGGNEILSATCPINTKSNNFVTERISSYRVVDTSSSKDFDRELIVPRHGAMEVPRNVKNVVLGNVP